MGFISLCGATYCHKKEHYMNRCKVYFNFLPAALAEAGLEIAFQVRHGQLSLAVEVVTFVHPHRQCQNRCLDEIHLVLF